MQSTASSLSLSASFGVTSSAAVKRDMWFVQEPPGVTRDSAQPGLESLGGTARFQGSRE